MVGPGTVSPERVPQSLRPKTPEAARGRTDSARRCWSVRCEARDQPRGPGLASRTLAHTAGSACVLLKTGAG